MAAFLGELQLEGLALVDLLNFGSENLVGQPAYEVEGKKSTFAWLVSDTGVYNMVQDRKTVDEIKPGIYTVYQDNQGGMSVEPVTINSDELFSLPNNKVQKMLDGISDFWTRADAFAEAKLIFKRGILLHGEGGTGKSSILNILAQQLVEKGGLVFVINNTNQLLWYIDFMHDQLRIADPKRPVIVLIEDLEKYTLSESMESNVLNWLSGPRSVAYQVVVATTNYYDTLSDLMLRPERFDIHIEIEKPKPDAKKAWLLHKNVDEETAEKWSQTTEGFSFAEFKELFICAKLLGHDYEEAKANIRDQSNDVVNKTSKKHGKVKPTGFTFGNKKD